MSSPNTVKRHAILFVHSNTWFTEMFRVAHALKKDGRYIPTIHFAYPYPTIKQDQVKLLAHQIEFDESPAHLTRPSLSSLNLSGFFNLFVDLSAMVSRVIIAALRRLGKFNGPLLALFKTTYHVQTSVRETAYFEQLIRKKNAAITVMAGDLVGYNTPEIAKASRNAGRPCVIVPSTMSDGTEQAEAYYFDPSFSCERRLNRIAAKIWPRWQKIHKGKAMVRLPAEQVAAREILGLAPEYPWVSSSSKANAIAVESRAMFEYYRRCGISEDSLVITGSIANDILFNTPLDKRTLEAELGLQAKPIMILTPLVPDFLYMPGGRPECEFSNYDELAKYWVGKLGELTDANIVISLHPSVDPKDFRHLESENVKISTRTILDLIPACDLFVASVSSTIRWSVACGKPVLNYDVYKYRYADFRNVNGVIHIETKAEYEAYLKNLTTDPNLLDSLKSQVKGEAEKWGRLDGKEALRLIDLFESEINKTEGISHGNA